MGWCLRGVIALVATLSASAAWAGSMAPYQNSDLAGPGPHWNAMSDRGGHTRYVPVPVRSADEYYAYDGGYSSAYQATGAAYGAPPSYGRPSYVGPTYGPPIYADPGPAYGPPTVCCEPAHVIERQVHRKPSAVRRGPAKRPHKAKGPSRRYVERYMETYPAPVQYVERYAPPPPAPYAAPVQYVETYAAPPPVQYVETYPRPAPYPDPYYVGEPRFQGQYAPAPYQEIREVYQTSGYGYRGPYAPPACSSCACGPGPQREFHVYSYGGAEQHYGAPRCDSRQGWSCGCDASGARMPGEITLGPGFMYSDGGVGPIPDSGYVGGGGGGGGSSGGISFNQGGGGASAYASANAYSSSSSNVTINYGGGYRGGHGGGKGGGGKGGGHGGGGGCNTCGGGHGGGGGHH